MPPLPRSASRWRMDEVWVRLALVASALGIAFVVAFILRFRAKSPRRLETTGLNVGVYLFTSSACPDCGPARTKLSEKLSEGFVEMSWEEEPAVFEKLGVSGVPATLVVEADGSGTLFPGQPGMVLNRLGP
jgi:hypothetical protein